MKRARDASWTPHRDPTTYKKDPVPTVKAYKNQAFLSSPHARSMRIAMEYEETMQRLAAKGVCATVQFFGSARAVDKEQYSEKHDMLSAKLKEAACDSAEAVEARQALSKHKKLEWMCEYIDKTRELARRLTEWSIAGKLSREASTINGVSRNKSLAKLEQEEEKEEPTSGPYAEAAATTFRYAPHATESRFTSDVGNSTGLFVCTGGAGGFMEAANRGAADVPGGQSIGMGISLPFETGLNPYVTPELAFEYHYFFTRKLCMAFHMQALVVAPGGFGTCDEMFEMMTLKQTGKMQAGMPIVLLGKAYWERTINWDAFEEAGVINQKEIDELLFTDDVDEAFTFLVTALGAMSSSPEIS